MSKHIPFIIKSEPKPRKPVFPKPFNIADLAAQFPPLEVPEPPKDGQVFDPLCAYCCYRWTQNQEMIYLINRDDQAFICEACEPEVGRVRKDSIHNLIISAVQQPQRIVRPTFLCRNCDMKFWTPKQRDNHQQHCRVEETFEEIYYLEEPAAIVKREPEEVEEDLDISYDFTYEYAK